MPVRTSYALGTPCWADVSTLAIDQGIAFLTGLLGWSAHTVPDPEAGGYMILQHGEHPVAGAMPAQDGGPPPMWNTYFACEDVDASRSRTPTRPSPRLRDAAARSSTGRSTRPTGRWPSWPTRRARCSR